MKPRTDAPGERAAGNDPRWKGAKKQTAYYSSM